MSRFSRAYEGAIATANLTRAQAAAGAGLDASVVSRLLSGERDAQAEHVAALIGVLHSESDREHCICEFLADQCPDEYRQRLVVHFGVVRESRPRSDDPLARNFDLLEEAATSNPDLRKLITNLAAMFGTRADKS